MKKIVIALSLLLVSFMAASAIAADKVVVVPLSTSKVPAQALPLAWGFIDGTNNTILTGYNVDSVTRPNTGVYNVKMSVSWEGMPAVIATSFNSGPPYDEIITWGGSLTVSDTVNFYIIDEATTPKNSHFSFVLYGTEKK
ncbi:MAG: hypothetical protein OEM01_11300 [Desulfobulbaceae bacterium]|nr:hypothetical protein [Desulfobulbaceae bacterium]